MRDYMGHSKCLMSFLQSALDDPFPGGLRWSMQNCSPELLLTNCDFDLANRAGLFRRRSYSTTVTEKNVGLPQTFLAIENFCGLFHI